jgi:hypothetical protein
LDLFTEKKVQECRCKIQSKGWILGILESLARLQDIWDHEKDVHPGIFEQFTTTS